MAVMEKQGLFRQISLRLKSLQVPILILLLGILLISVLSWETRKGALEQLRKQFVIDAAMRTSAINDALEEHLIDLEGLCSFFNASTSVTGQAFAAFVAPILKNRPGVQAFEWIPRVAYPERTRFEAEARRNGFKGYQIYQLDAEGHKVAATPRQYYYPVFYAEPRAGNEPALGFDLGSNPARLSALEQAAGTGRAVATERLTLVQETGTQAGFLIFIPVYRQEMAAKTVEERRLALRGFVLGVFRAGDALEVAIRHSPEDGLVTELVDQYGALDERLLYRFARGQLPSQGLSWRTLLTPAVALRYEHPFTYASRQWLVNISASPAYVQDHISLFYWLIPPLGVLLTLLLALYSWTLLSHKERAEALAIERTASLTETTNMLRMIIEAIPVRVFWKDADLRYLGCNTLFAGDAGCNSPQEVLGQDDFAMVWKDQAELYRADDRQVMESRRPKLNIIEPQTTPTGAKIWLNTSKVPLQKPNGEVFGVLGVYEDITERKQAEEAFQVLVNQAPMGIFIVQDGKFQLINPGFEQISGYAAGELLGRESMRLVSPDFRQMVRENAIRTLKGEPGPACEFPILTKSGETRWVMEKVTSTLYQGERAALGYFIDISEHRSLETQLLQAQKMEAVGTLAGGIAHDFNNILTAILGNIGLAILDDKIGPRVRDRLAQAEQACVRAQSLSQQLLTFAKGGAPIKKIIPVAKLLTESIAFTCAGSSVRYKTSFPENLWSIEADPGQIGQIFQNLTINAIQAMPTGGTIKVRAENLSLGADSDLPLEAGRYLKITVQDQGIGIAAQHLPKIFDPYFTTKQKGSGLGLASTYAIVKNHHGHINVESKQGMGTTFHIYLPAIDRRVAPQPAADTGLPLGKGKILVMDDEEMVREVLGRMLALLGYGVELARDGVEAIERFVQAQKSGQAFAAVILDLTIPAGLGGKDTVAQLRKIDPRIKAIVSSGYSDDPIMADFRKYGFSGVIAKPYRISEVGRLLQEVVMGSPEPGFGRKWPAAGKRGMSA